MEVYFGNDIIAEVAQSNKPHCRDYRSLPKEVIRSFHRAIGYFQSAKDIEDIKRIKGLHYEPLKGKLKGLHSIRLGYKYRAILQEDKDGIIVIGVIFIEINNHYA